MAARDAVACAALRALRSRDGAEDMEVAERLVFLGATAEHVEAAAGRPAAQRHQRVAHARDRPLALHL